MQGSGALPAPRVLLPRSLQAWAGRLACHPCPPLLRPPGPAGRGGKGGYGEAAEYARQYQAMMSYMQASKKSKKSMEGQALGCLR